MGWWGTDHDDDVIGDGPVDTVVGDLRSEGEDVGSRPSFQELLDALTMIMCFYRGDILVDPDSYQDQQLEAVFEPPAPTLVSNADPLAQIRDRSSRASILSVSLTLTFHRIVRQYERSELRRKPRFTEVLELFAFPLRVRPERLLRDAAGLELKEFRGRPGGPA